MTSEAPSTFRLVRVPIAIAVLISVARLVAEVNGWVPPQSGGALNPLGISWLSFVFGAYFAVRLNRAGSAPRVRRAWPWASLLLALTFGAVLWQFRPFFEAPKDDETFARLREAVLVLVAIASTAGLLTFVLWSRLAWTLLCYAVPTRLVVFGLTWLAKREGWDTHYTKFGPPGIERDSMAETMTSTAIAQGGFWVPFTVVCGVAVGALFVRRKPA